MKKVLALSLLAALLVSLCGCSLLPAEEATPEKPLLEASAGAKYNYTTAAVGDTQLTATLSAVYSASVYEELYFAESGLALYIVHCSVGDTVKAGDVIAELDTTDIVTRLNELNLDLDDVKGELDYIIALWPLQDELFTLRMENGTAAERAQAELDREAALAAHQARQGVLEIELARLEREIAQLEAKRAGRMIVAGIDGTITTMGATDATYTSSVTKPYVVISDLTSAVFIVEDKDASVFQVGADVSLAKSGDTCTGVVIAASELGLEEAEDIVYIKPVSTSGEIANGTKYKATVVLDSRSGVIILPNKAVSKISGGYGCYTLNEDGIIETKELTVGLVGDKYTEIISGIEEGDKVVSNY